jgi:hypothetical protein
MHILTEGNTSLLNPTLCIHTYMYTYIHILTDDNNSLPSPICHYSPETAPTTQVSSCRVCAAHTCMFVCVYIYICICTCRWQLLSRDCAHHTSVFLSCVRCTYMYVCLYVFVYTRTHTYTHTHINIWACMHVCVYMYVQICMYM